MDRLTARDLGSTVVVAPHPDDESIGCGGLIALLCDAGLPLAVALVSDGAASHPGSRRFSAAARRALRLAELRTALAALGVGAGAELLQIGCPDGAVPHAGQAGFDAAAAALAALLRRQAAATVVAPWRRDTHPDHRAAAAITHAAITVTAPRPRLLEYRVWADERGSAADQPRADEGEAIAFDIGAVRQRKRQAILSHRSQLGAVIDDDPGGFVLPQAMIDRALAPLEHYVLTSP